jgi:hypothetical protein
VKDSDDAAAADDDNAANDDEISICTSKTDIAKDTKSSLHVFKQI